MFARQKGKVFGGVAVRIVVVAQAKIINARTQDNG